MRALQKMADNGNRLCQLRYVAYGWLFNPKFPPSQLVDAFDQVVEPLITEIT